MYVMIRYVIWWYATVAMVRGMLRTVAMVLVRVATMSYVEASACCAHDLMIDTSNKDDMSRYASRSIGGVEVLHEIYELNVHHHH